MKSPISLIESTKGGQNVCNFAFSLSRQHGVHARATLALLSCAHGFLPLALQVRANSGSAFAKFSLPDDLVFRTIKGTPLNDKDLYNREIAPACDRIKLPRFSWHAFRQTHATLLHANGETLKTAQALLGHSDLETTLNVYTHTVTDSQRTAVEGVAGVLFSDVLSSASAATPGGRPS